MQIVVFGAGALGSLLGGLLAESHEVTLVGRDPHVAAVRESGLTVAGAVDRAVRPAATTDGRNLRADLAVVTVKAYDLATAGEQLRTGAFDAGLVLTNGLDTVAPIAGGESDGGERIGNRDGAGDGSGGDDRDDGGEDGHRDEDRDDESDEDRADWPVLAGTATYGAELAGPGRVRCTGVGEVVLGPPEGGTSPVADRVGEAFRRAGVETVVSGDLPRRRWEKVAVNAAINGPTALARVENGRLRSDRGANLARRAAREVAQVARAEGIDLSDRQAVAAVDRVADATADNRSSTYQDVADGRRTEVDAIYGAVIRRADRHDVAVPTLRTLAELLWTWERGAGVRDR